MNIFAKRGDKVRFTGASDCQLGAYGCGEDPRGILTEGEVYAVAEVKVMAFHSVVYLDGIQGGFNSVCFDEI